MAGFNTSNLGKRCGWLFLGMVLMAFGFTLVTKAALGNPPISSVPLILSKFLPLSFGTAMFILNTVFILAQWGLLKEKFAHFQWLQMIINVIFSVLIDLAMLTFAFIQPESFLVKITLLLVGSIIAGLGLSLQLAPDVLVAPGEGVVGALTAVTKKEFGTVKVLFDSSFVIMSLVISLLVFGNIQDLGIGTIISTLILGHLIKFWSDMPFMDKIRSLKVETESEILREKITNNF